MTTTTIAKKQLKQEIQHERTFGKTNQEIYDLLKAKYDDKKFVAMTITETATTYDMKKYKVPYIMLLILLGFSIVGDIILAIEMVAKDAAFSTAPMLVILPLVNTLLFIGIYKFTAPAYRLCSFVYICGLFKGFQELQDPLEIIITLVVFLAVILLPLYLDQKLFPQYRPMKLKENENGEYVL